jgi:hypothetical protein
LKYVQQNSDQYNANTTLLTCIVHWHMLIIRRTSEIRRVSGALSAERQSNSGLGHYNQFNKCITWNYSKSIFS